MSHPFCKCDLIKFHCDIIYNNTISLFRMLFVLPHPPIIHRQDHLFLSKTMHHRKGVHVFTHVLIPQTNQTQSQISQQRSVGLTLRLRNALQRIGLSLILSFVRILRNLHFNLCISDILLSTGFFLRLTR